MTQGERVKAVRKSIEVNLTMEKFGERLGVTKTAISLIESGKNNVTDVNIKAICREFNVDEHWLRTGEGEMFNPAPSTALDALADEYGLSADARAFIGKFVGFKPEVQETFLKCIREMSSPFYPENE